MKESVALAKDADAKKVFSSTRSDNSILRLRNEPENQLGSLRSVIGNIRHDGGTPSRDSIATELSSMHSAQRASVLLALQRTHGNRYVQRVVAGIQAKLKVGQPGDVYEQEADRVADEVMRMPEPQVQRQPEEEEEEEEEELLIQTKPIADQITPLVQRRVEKEEQILQTRTNPSQTSEVTPDLESRINAIKSDSQSLPKSVRAFFEPRFGYDFRNVRLHTDTRAAETARALNARAFTTGLDIVFGDGQYAPEKSEGKKLLAHELTHVIQQSGITVAPLLRCSQPSEPLEKETVVEIQLRVQGHLVGKQSEATGVVARQDMHGFEDWLFSKEGKKFSNLRKILEENGYKFKLMLMIVDESESTTAEGFLTWEIKKYHLDEIEIKEGEKPPAGAYILPYSVCPEPWTIESPNSKWRKKIAHKSIVSRCCFLIKQLPPEKLIIALTPEDEIRASMLSAGVDPEFQINYGLLMNQARSMAEVTDWQTWKEISEGEPIPEKLCGEAFENIIGELKTDLMKIFTSEGIAKIFGSALTVITLATKVGEAAMWDNDKEPYNYRTNLIYWYLLRLAAKNMNAGREDGVQPIYSMLVNKTMIYEEWLKKKWPKLREHLKIKYGEKPMTIETAPPSKPIYLEPSMI